MKKILQTIIVIMLIASLAGIAIGQDTLDAVSGNTVTQSRLADIVANDYNSKSIPEQQTQVTLTRVTGNTVPQSRTADIVSYDIANSYDGSGSSSSYVPTALPEITSAPAEITNIPLLNIIPTPTDTPAPTPAPTITPSKGIRKKMAEKGVDYDLQLSGPEPEVLWGNFCVNVTPQGSEVRIKGVVHTQLCPSRDFKPGSYLVNISKEGYQNFSQVFVLADEELKNINVSLELITPAIIEAPVQNESVIEPAQNTTNMTTQIVPENPENAGIYLMSFVGVIVLLAGFVYIRQNKMSSQNNSVDDMSDVMNIEDDRKAEDRLLELFTTDGMAKALKVNPRTIQRVKNKLESDNRWPIGK